MLMEIDLPLQIGNTKKILIWKKLITFASCRSNNHSIQRDGYQIATSLGDDQYTQFSSFISRGKRSTAALGFRALLFLMPSRTTNETSTRGAVFASAIVPIAAGGSIVGSAIVKIRHVLVDVVILPDVVMPALVRVDAPTTTCPTTFACRVTTTTRMPHCCSSCCC